jgi:hypothetical protein
MKRTVSRTQDGWDGGNNKKKKDLELMKVILYFRFGLKPAICIG